MKKKTCNDDMNIYMVQSFLSGQKVNCGKRMADQGNVLEGVADKPFFLTSSSRAFAFFSIERQHIRLLPFRLTMQL